MTGTPESSPLGTAQRWVLVLIAVALAIGLVVLRGGIQSESPMEQLARRSLDPQTALTNGRPTLIEFYADWCQVCREMAPSMLDLEKQSRDQLDVVLVNVDNPRWQDLVDRYDVNGIPQLNLFNAEGGVSSWLMLPTPGKAGNGLFSSSAVVSSWSSSALRKPRDRPLASPSALNRFNWGMPLTS